MIGITCNFLATNQADENLEHKFIKKMATPLGITILCFICHYPRALTTQNISNFKIFQTQGTKNTEFCLKKGVNF